jgi:hypothetical protein
MKTRNSYKFPANYFCHVVACISSWSVSHTQFTQSTVQFMTMGRWELTIPIRLVHRIILIK